MGTMRSNENDGGTTAVQGNSPCLAWVGRARWISWKQHMCIQPVAVEQARMNHPAAVQYR